MAILPLGAVVLPPAVIPASAQAFAKSAVHTSDAFQKPSAITVSFTLSLVTATGTSKIDGTSILPLATLPFTILAGGVPPPNSVNASWAAVSASGLIALYTV